MQSILKLLADALLGRARSREAIVLTRLQARNCKDFARICGQLAWPPPPGPLGPPWPRQSLGQ